jgi:hypothetical protein
VGYENRSINGRRLGPDRYSPTAKQFVVDAQATPLRLLRIVPAGAGVLTIDQLAPFHVSTRRVGGDDDLKKSPTA